MVDATHWGERTESTDWCSTVARDPRTKEDICWKFSDKETTTIYLQIRQELEALGYIILSVTGDGFGGIRTAFKGIPYQMCHVHMERIVTRKITNNPKLEAGIVLLAVVKTLHDTSENIFRMRFNEYMLRYRDFLNERSLNYESGREEFTHRNLRSAVRSVRNLTPFLFTFERGIWIPKTTNSIEGHFSHIRDVINIHRGLSRKQKERALHTLFLFGTIAPNEDDLDELL